MKTSARAIQILFDATAWGYDVITHHGIWAKHIEHVCSHVESLDSVETVLDLGCGPGISAFVLAERLPHAKVVGLDISEEMIRRARHHKATRYAHLSNVHFEQGDATRMTYERDSFDLAFGHSFLYLVPDPVAVLTETCRVLRPSRTLVLTEPNRAGNLASAAIESRTGWRHLVRQPVTTGRFVISMAAWRAVSGVVGQLDATRVEDWFEAGGFEQVSVRPTLGGLGLLCMGASEN